MFFPPPRPLPRHSSSFSACNIETWGSQSWLKDAILWLLPGVSSLEERRPRSWETPSWLAESPWAPNSAPPQSGSGKINLRLRGEYPNFIHHLDQSWTISHSAYLKTLCWCRGGGFIQRFSRLSQQPGLKSPNLIWSKPGSEFLPSVPPKAGEGPGLGWWAVLCTYAD